MSLCLVVIFHYNFSEIYFVFNHILNHEPNTLPEKYVLARPAKVYVMSILVKTAVLTVFVCPQDELEVVLQVNGSSYVALGWRPIGKRRL